MVHIIVSIKMTDDHISKGITPESISPVTTRIIEFLPWRNVACEPCFYATLAIFAQLNPIVSLVGLGRSLP
jgi:hypothetical protein